MSLVPVSLKSYQTTFPYVGKSLSDSEKLFALEDHFKPHKLYRFPQRDEYGKKRSFITGAAKRIRDKYPKAFYFHCTAHRLNLCVAHALKSTSVSNMFSVITSTANFFNYSPKRQKSLEIHVAKYPCNTLRTKLLPLCRTRWVERINALEVALDLLDTVVQTFCSMVNNTGKE